MIKKKSEKLVTYRSREEQARKVENTIVHNFDTGKQVPILYTQRYIKSARMATNSLKLRQYNYISNEYHKYTQLCMW